MKIPTNSPASVINFDKCRLNQAFGIRPGAKDIFRDSELEAPELLFADDLRQWLALGTSAYQLLKKKLIIPVQIIPCVGKQGRPILPADMAE